MKLGLRAPSMVAGVEFQRETNGEDKRNGRENELNAPSLGIYIYIYRLGPNEQV